MHSKNRKSYFYSSSLILIAIVAMGIQPPLAFAFDSENNSCAMRFLDGGGSPGTYEPDPDNPRRPDDHGGPYNEPGSDDDRGRGGGNDHGGPYNEPGSDGGPY